MVKHIFKRQGRISMVANTNRVVNDGTTSLKSNQLHKLSFNGPLQNCAGCKCSVMHKIAWLVFTNHVAEVEYKGKYVEGIRTVATAVEIGHMCVQLPL